MLKYNSSFRSRSVDEPGGAPDEGEGGSTDSDIEEQEAAGDYVKGEQGAGDYDKGEREVGDYDKGEQEAGDLC